MGNQDIRETAGRGKRRRSLAAKTVHSTLLSCMLLGAVALIIGLGLYGSALVQRSISRAFETAEKAAVSAEKGADSIGLSKEIMAVYRSLTRCRISCQDGGHQAIRMDENRRPVLNGKNCVGCHLCILVCPQRAIVPGSKRITRNGHS